MSFGIILPHRWTRQPQGPVEVDYGAQLINGLRVAYAPWMGDRNLVTGRLLTLTGTDSNLSPGQTGIGRVWTAESSNTYLNEQTTFASGFTALGVIRPDATDELVIFRNKQVSEGNGGQLFRLSGGQSNYVIAGVKSVATDTVTPTATVGRTTCVALSVTGITNPHNWAFYANGLVGSSGTESSLATAGAVGYDIGSAADGAIYQGKKSLYLVLVWDRVLSVSEAVSVTRNPWQIFRPLQRRIYVPSAGVGGDITQALTGQAVTGSAGTLVPSHEQSLSGQAATATAGTLAPGHSQALSGQEATASSGTLAPSHSQALSGSAATSAAGTLGVERTIALSGQAVTATAGTITYTTVGAVNVTLTGQAVAAEAGTLTPSHSQALTGQAVAAEAGTVTYTGGSVLTIALTGQAVTASAGTMSPAVALLLSGSSIVVSAGTVTTSGGTPVVTDAPAAHTILGRARARTKTGAARVRSFTGLN